ncbi:MAG: hypothetical protein CMP08_05700 [Xanthomonadales bacterium]|nr:hypothetical protein [Xanthomonadales bacterium]
MAPGYIARYVVVNYLEAKGLNVDIDKIDINLLTGHIAIDDAHGEITDGPNAGQGFTIGHLGLELAYPPLLNHRIVLESISLRGASIDITRSPDTGLTIAGVPLPQGQSSGGRAWRFGVEHVQVGALRVHYRQPATGQTPAIDQVITLNQSGAENMVTWRQGEPIPVDAHLGAAGGSLSLSGSIAALADNPSADLHIRAENFPVSVLAPWVRQAGIDRLDGRIDTQLDLSLSYDADKHLLIHSDGQTAFEGVVLVRTDGMRIDADAVSFDGVSDWQLMRAGAQPGEITTDGRFAVDGLSIQKDGTLDLTADKAAWAGQSFVSLDDPFRITTHGTYNDANVRLVSGDRLRLEAASEHLTGDLETTFGKNRTTIVSNGAYRATGFEFAVPGSLSTQTDAMNWQGTTQTTLTDKATRIDTNGQLGGTDLVFVIPRTSTFTAGDIDWDGQTHIDSGALFVHSARGRLASTDARLDLQGVPLAFVAHRFIYDGRYAQTPDASGNALKLMMSGEAMGTDLDMRNTTIDAPWLATLQDHATGIEIDGLSDIRVDRLETSGVRIMGDTNTDSEVVQAVSLDLKNFHLRDLLHYELESAELEDAIMHVRRDSSGYGVISEYLGGDGQDSAKAQAASSSEDTSKNTTGGATASTFSIKHLGISGPSVWFVDTVTQPNVALHGMDLNFVLNDLDTAKPEQDADYRLSIDLGAYGHFDSTGTVAPLASGGMNMDIDAWLRSLNMPSLSGYLNQAMGRKIARGAINGTLNLEAKSGQLDGKLQATISNFRLANDSEKVTEIALGINMETALAIIRGQDDEFTFQTSILGDITNPYFSVDNLVREAVLAGIRTALFSNYSPVGLANKLKNAFLNLFRSVEGRPAVFAAGKHYVRPEDRPYMGLIAQAMNKNLDWTLTVEGQGVPADAKAMGLFQTGRVDEDNRIALKELARSREQAIRDYLAARGVSPERIISKGPTVLDDADARPIVRFTLDKQDD